MMSCSECFYSEPIVTDDGDPTMECHRYPPGVVEDDDDMFVRLYPQVDGTDWCGEYLSQEIVEEEAEEEMS